jgi:predicted  nucleic acid-binding Zn-ribbon protein
MPILDQLRRGVDTARSKADQMMRINRVQGEIKSIRRESQAVREKIADGVIELYQKGALSHQELEDLCVAIDGLNAQITEKEAQIASIRAGTPPQAPPE